MEDIGLIVHYSYPRLTLDFHTNKRIIDEVVCYHIAASCFASHSDMLS